MTQFSNKLDVELLIERHDDPEDKYHLNLHEVGIGNQWKWGVTYMELTTPHLKFNVGCSLQSGCLLHVQADGSFDLCTSKLGVTVFEVNSRNLSAHILVHYSE